MGADRWLVRLDAPAATQFLHIVRLTAAGAAAEAGLNTEEVDDVKIAVDELCSLVIDAAGGTELLRLEFGAVDGGLVVEAGASGAAELEVDELAKAILDATVDQLELNHQQSGGSFRFTKYRSDR